MSNQTKPKAKTLAEVAAKLEANMQRKYPFLYEQKTRAQFEEIERLSKLSDFEFFIEAEKKLLAESTQDIKQEQKRKRL